MEEKGKMEPERSDQYKQGRIPLLEVFIRGAIKGKKGSLSGGCSHLKELVRVLKRQTAASLEQGNAKKLLSTTLRTPMVARSWGESSLFKPLSG